MKSKLSFVAILTLFLVSLTFIILNAVKHTKELKEKQDNVNELNTKVSTLEKVCDEKASEYNDLKIKYDELSSEKDELVITIEELEKQTVTTEEETTEVTETKEEVTTEAVYVEVTEEVYVEEPIEASEPAVVPVEEETEEVVTHAEDDGMQYSARYDTDANRLTRSNGVVYYNGHKETWYSTNEAAGQATAVSIPGKHVAEDGTIRDEDGYICVASSDLAFYTVVDTTLGPAKVYDCGCSHGTIDVYTNW